MKAEETSKPGAEGSWLDKCPVCKSNELSTVAEKKLFGLVTSRRIECSCGAVFEPRGVGYELTRVEDTLLPVWQGYGHQILTEREWRNIAHGGMSDAKQREADMEIWWAELRKGNIPIRMIAEAPIILKRNEEVRIVLSGVCLLEARAVRRGSYGGGSIRVAKGVRLSTGSFQAESREELRHIDRGTLTLTNKRLVFSGAKRTVNVGLAQIVSVEPYEKNGIALRRTRKQKTEYFTDFPRAELEFAVEDRVYKEPLSGVILTHLIEALVRQMD